MARSPRPRKTVDLSESLYQRLNSYALLAAASGVSMLALVEPADAKIIYVPAHRHITLGHGVSLALNRDGIVNFSISVKQISTESGLSLQSLAVSGARQGNSVAGYLLGSTDSYLLASVLQAGQRIGTAFSFQGGRLNMAAASSKGACFFGRWANVKRRYLGLKFRVKKGPTQYGWARLSVSCQGGIILRGLLTGYAYETIPNKSIIAGKTSGPDVITVDSGSLGKLAQGWAGRSAK
jgi:hypothetical protein